TCLKFRRVLIRSGADTILRVPDGTVVSTQDGTVLADLTGIGSRFVAARGGRGGLGNAALASRQRKAPGFALLGEPGEERSLVLELKTVARSEEHTSELQSRFDLVCRLLLEKKKTIREE